MNHTPTYVARVNDMTVVYNDHVEPIAEICLATFDHAWVISVHRVIQARVSNDNGNDPRERAEALLFDLLGTSALALKPFPRARLSEHARDVQDRYADQHGTPQPA